MRINNNTNSMSAVQSLQDGQKAFESSLNKIATGRRINKAADDASGLIIADSLASQAQGMGQAIRNATDAISMTQIADGALQNSSQIVQTIREKALQAANGSQSYESRQAIQADIDKMMAQLDNIAQTTSYNGQRLLTGDFTDKSFQIGANPGETVSISIGSAASNNLGSNATGRLSEIDVTSEKGAQRAIQIADQALADLNKNRSQIGSVQNQLTSSIQNLSSSQINVYASESTIRDTDMAEESMVLSRLKLLNQARAYALSQTKEKGNSILGLLKG